MQGPGQRQTRAHIAGTSTARLNRAQQNHSIVDFERRINQHVLFLSCSVLFFIFCVLSSACSPAARCGHFSLQSTPRWHRKMSSLLCQPAGGGQSINRTVSLNGSAKAGTKVGGGVFSLSGEGTRRCGIWVPVWDLGAGGEEEDFCLSVCLERRREKREE